MNLSRSGLRLFGAKASRAGAMFIGTVVFARELGAAGIGTFFLFEVLLGLLAIPADLGLRGAVEKRVSEGANAGRFLGAAVLLKLLPLAVVVSVIAVARQPINSYVGASVAGWLALGLVLDGYSQLFIRALYGELRVGDTAGLHLLRDGGWLLISGLLLLFGFGPIGLVYGRIVGMAGVLIGAVVRRRTPIRQPKRQQIESLVNFARYSAVSQAGSITYGWMDVAFIGIFLSQAAVGAYEVAWRVAGLITIASGVVGTTLFPQLSEWDATGAKAKIEAAIPDAVTASLALVIPAIGGATVFAEEILTLVFNPEFVIASVALVILMTEKLFQAVHAVTGRALQAIDEPRLAARASVIAVVVNIGLNVLLIPTVGLVGAAVATAVSFGLNTMLHIAYLRRYLTLRVRYWELAWCSGAAVVMTVGLVPIVDLVTTLPRLLTAVGLGAVVYAVLLAVHPALRIKMVRLGRAAAGG